MDRVIISSATANTRIWSMFIISIAYTSIFVLNVCVARMFVFITSSQRPHLSTVCSGLSTPDNKSNNS